MGKACAIIPKVLNKRGEKVDSRLFRDLLSHLSNDRAMAVKIYKITKSQQFIQEWNPKLTLDDNNEPTLRSLIKEGNLKEVISEEAVLKQLNRNIGHYKKGTNEPHLINKTKENYKEIKNKVRKFNKESEFKDDYVARVIQSQDSKTSESLIGVKVERKNKQNSIEADKLEYNETLNERLMGILSSYGVSVGHLTELEERMGINGVTEFDQAKIAAGGLIELIRLAKGLEGKKALPEEFAHFAIEALGSNNPITSRLINLIIDKNLIKEIIGEDYDLYEERYNGDEVKLAKEAAGKLLAKHLLQAVEIPTKPYKNLLQRLIASIKNFFKRLSANSIQKAIIQADKEFGTLAENILNGSLNDEINIDNITITDTLYSIKETVTKEKKLLQDIIDTELKRLYIYKSRTENPSFNKKQKLLIQKLETSLEENQAIEGIYSFLKTAFNTFAQLNTKLTNTFSTSNSTIQQKASILRDTRNYLYSYKSILREIRQAVIDEGLSKNNRYGKEMRVVLDKTTIFLTDLYSKYEKLAIPLFIEFLKPFLGEEITVPFGKWKGKTIKVEDLIEKAEKDISFFDLWLDSMADSSSYMLKIMDQAVKKAREEARLSTIGIMKQIQAATIKLEQAGIKDTEWMFERDDLGNLTGNYIFKLNYGKFNANKEEMLKMLSAKYGERPVGEDAKKYNAEKKAWFLANTEKINGIRKPKRTIYSNQAFNKLNVAQKNYWNTIMRIKDQLDSYLPKDYTTLNNAVKIRKDLLERVKASKDIKSGAKQIWENVKDQFMRRSDDTEFGDRATIDDFENHTVQKLPIYYTKLRQGESANDMSTDVAGTLTAYAAMANNFKEMNKIINLLELGRDILKDNLSIQKTSGDKVLKEEFSILGRKVSKNSSGKAEASNLIKKLDMFFNRQVYERYIQDEGTFGNTKIDKAKSANFLNKITSLNTMAGNILLGISNIATGKIMMRIESFSKEFFSEKDTIKADKEYSKQLPGYLAELGNRVKTNKLALWEGLFNVFQDYENEIKGTKFNRKTWASRLLTPAALFAPTRSGEHWMQNRTALALANTYKMKTPKGKIVSLWDAMEVVYIDPHNKALGAKLQVKKGYTKADGTDFTKEDIYKFSRKVTAINQRMHGIYNLADSSAIQYLALGRMAIMFRKWIKPSINRRFSNVEYNMDLESWTEGYYRTTGRFLTQLAKDLRQTQFDLGSRWEELTKTEKSNIIRAITEVVHYLAILAAKALINWDDDDSYQKKLLEYQTRRLQTEIGVLIPGKPMLDEGLKILKSPAAAIQTIQSTLDLVGLLNPMNYEEFAGDDALITSRQNEGHSKAYGLILKSPLAPMRNTIIRGTNPDLVIPYFK